MSNKEQIGIPIPITGNFTKVASVLTGVLKYFQAADCGPEDVLSVVDGILAYGAAMARTSVTEISKVVMTRAAALDDVLSDPSNVERIKEIATVDLTPGAKNESWNNNTREDLN